MLASHHLIFLCSLFLTLGVEGVHGASQRGLVIGGSVAGAFVGCVCIVLAVVLLRREVRKSKEFPTTVPEVPSMAEKGSTVNSIQKLDTVNDPPPPLTINPNPSRSGPNTPDLIMTMAKTLPSPPRPSRPSSMQLPPDSPLPVRYHQPKSPSVDSASRTNVTDDTPTSPPRPSRPSSLRLPDSPLPPVRHISSRPSSSGQGADTFRSPLSSDASSGGLTPRLTASLRLPSPSRRTKTHRRFHSSTSNSNGPSDDHSSSLRRSKSTNRSDGDLSRTFRGIGGSRQDKVPEEKSTRRLSADLERSWME